MRATRMKALSQSASQAHIWKLCSNSWLPAARETEMERLLPLELQLELELELGLHVQLGRFSGGYFVQLLA